MKKLNVTPISDTAQMPIKKGTLQFIQDAYKEIVGDVLKAIIGSTYDNSKFYAINGLVNSGSYPVYNITDGVIFYGGELFECDAVAFTATGSNVAVFNLAFTQYTTDADPVLFTDGNTYNVHNIVKLSLVQGATGTGLSNYSDVIFVNLTAPKQATQFVLGLFKLATQAQVEAGILFDCALTPAVTAAATTLMHVEGGARISRMEIPIGDWNMDSVITKDVIHGITNWSTIRIIQVTIFDDGGAYANPLNAYDSGNLAGGIVRVDNYLIRLTRATGGLFDNTDYDTTPFNRGFITIEYQS